MARAVRRHLSHLKKLGVHVEVLQDAVCWPSGVAPSLHDADAVRRRP